MPKLRHQFSNERRGALHPLSRILLKFEYFKTLFENDLYQNVSNHVATVKQYMLYVSMKLSSPSNVV